MSVSLLASAPHFGHLTLTNSSTASDYKYIRGEYTRFSVEDEKGNIFIETDNLEEAKEFINNELKK